MYLRRKLKYGAAYYVSKKVYKRSNVWSNYAYCKFSSDVTSNGNKMKIDVIFAKFCIEVLKFWKFRFLKNQSYLKSTYFIQSFYKSLITHTRTIRLFSSWLNDLIFHTFYVKKVLTPKNCYASWKGNFDELSEKVFNPRKGGERERERGEGEERERERKRKHNFFAAYFVFSVLRVFLVRFYVIQPIWFKNS